MKDTNFRCVWDHLHGDMNIGQEEAIHALGDLHFNYKSELEVAWATASALREQNNRLVKILASVHGFIVPDVEGPDGVVYRFHDPDPHRTLRALSNAIKQIPELIAAL